MWMHSLEIAFEPQVNLTGMFPGRTGGDAGELAKHGDTAKMSRPNFRLWFLLEVCLLAVFLRGWQTAGR